MNDLLSESFEIPPDQPSRDGDIELGAPPMNSEDVACKISLVQETEKQIEKVNKLLRKIQNAHEESKAVTKAAAMKESPAIRQKMEKEVDEVGKVALFIKAKIEELDREIQRLPR